MKKIIFANLIILLINIISYSQFAWKPMNANTKEFILSVFFTNINTGFITAGTSHGSILRTTNAGENWDIVYTDPSDAFGSICFVNENTGYSCGTGGVFLKTTNGGINWESKKYADEYKKGFIYFSPQIGETDGFIVGGNLGGNKGIIYKTSDGGNGWKNIPVNTYGLQSIVFINSLTGFAGGEGGVIIKSTDNGENWTSVNSATDITFTSFQFIDDNTGYVCGGNRSGSKGTILVTKNGGIDWQPLNLDSIPAITSIKFVNSNTGYGCCIDGKIIKTTDGGEQWKELKSNTNVLLMSLFFNDENTGYAVGQDGTLLKTTTGGE